MIQARFAKVRILPGAFYNSVVKYFKEYGFQIVGPNDKPDALVFTGGLDINPELYKEKPLSRTYFDRETDSQDLKAYYAFAKDKPKIGICRGAQLGNVLSGGKLWQDTDNHGGSHKVQDIMTGTTVTVSSCHHQMMRPGPEAVVLATTKRSTYVQAENEYKTRVKEDYDDIEVLYYPNTNFLCFQGHPEIDAKEGREYFRSLVEKHLSI